MEHQITQYCQIRNNQVFKNGNLRYSAEGQQDFSSFIKEVYKHFDMKYPKFYKMDSLCKLAIASTSVLLEEIEDDLSEDTAILLMNKSSCIDIDKKHQSTIENEGDSYVSPANFVYTLPNIAIGEICIKYKLKAEHSFFIFDTFNPKFVMSYAKSLLNLGKCESVICGWIDVEENQYNAFIFLVEKKEGVSFTEENLTALFLN